MTELKSTARTVHEFLLSAHPRTDDANLLKAEKLASTQEPANETLVAIRATRKADMIGVGYHHLNSMKSSA